MTHTSSKKEEERLARLFHETYEMASAHFGYTTRTETREFNPDSSNGQLMIHVCNLVVKSELTQALKELKSKAIEDIQCYKVETEHGRIDQHYEYGVNRGLAIAIAILEGVEGQVIEDKQRESIDQKIKDLGGK